MIRKYLCFLLVLFSACNVFGQTDASGTNPDLENFEIGLDGMTPIRNDFGLSLLLKKRISTPVQPKKWVKCGSLRMLTTFYNDTRERQRNDIFFRGIDSIKYNLDTTQTVSSTVALGYERQFYKKRVRLSFGGDIQFRYNEVSRRSTLYYETANDRYPQDMTISESKEYRSGISLFAGFNYYITKHLSLGTEIHLPVMAGVNRTDYRNLTKGFRSVNTIFDVDIYEPWPRLLYLGLHF